MRKVVILTLIGIMVTGSSCALRRVHTERELYQRAMAHLEGRRFAFAERDFTLVLELNENQERAYYYRGIVRIQLEDFSGAVSDLTQAIRLNPDYTETRFLRGMAYLRNEDYLLAVKDFSSAILRNEKEARFFHARAQAKVGLEDYRGAISDYDQAIKYSNGKNYQYYLDRAEAFIFLRAFPSALADLNYLVRKQPRNPNHYMYRASVRLRAGDREGACLDWSRAGELGDIDAYDYIREYCN